MKMEGIAFDLEGTIVDLESFHHNAHIQTAKNFGIDISIDWSIAKLDHFVGGPDIAVAQDIADHFPNRFSILEFATMKEELFKKTSSIGGINNTGKPKSEEHRKKISDSLRGERSPLPEDVKERISDSMIGNANSKNHSSSEYKSKQSNAMKNAWIRRKQKSLSSSVLVEQLICNQ